MPFKLENTYQQLFNEFVVHCRPESTEDPTLVFFNRQLALEQGLPFTQLCEQQLASLFSGNASLLDYSPCAQGYAGHQFGQYNPLLGDGRAHILGEFVSEKKRFDLCLKGSGRTPFSRGGDGKATLASMLREAIMAEAMNALHIPSTRSLAVVQTNESVFREQRHEGGVLARIASSHIRVGTFQFFAHQGKTSDVQELADYVIQRHYPVCSNDDEPYLGLLHEVVTAQAQLVAKWMSVGFIHGVLNTDNVSIAGETIDYGPCAFMETYDPKTVFSSIDHDGRYAYNNQPGITQWNLARFAETLLPLLGDDMQTAVDAATNAVDQFAQQYRQTFHEHMCEKLGFDIARSNRDIPAEEQLVDEWLAILKDHNMDFTLAWHELTELLEGNDRRLRAHIADDKRLSNWIAQYAALNDLNITSHDERYKRQLSNIVARMRHVNPTVIPRNHLVEEALESVQRDGDLSKFNLLYEKLMYPFAPLEHDSEYCSPAPKYFTQCYRTFCGT